MRDVLKMTLQSRQESYVVFGLHVELAEVLTQVLERVVDAAVDLHEALDSRCPQLLVERTQGCVPLTPVVYLCQRSVPLTTNRARQLYKNISMLFLFPVKDGNLSTGVNATSVSYTHLTLPTIYSV